LSTKVEHIVKELHEQLAASQAQQWQGLQKAIHNLEMQQSAEGHKLQTIEEQQRSLCSRQAEIDDKAKVIDEHSKEISAFRGELQALRDEFLKAQQGTLEECRLLILEQSRSQTERRCVAVEEAAPPQVAASHSTQATPRPASEQKQSETVEADHSHDLHDDDQAAESSLLEDAARQKTPTMDPPSCVEQISPETSLADELSVTNRSPSAELLPEPRESSGRRRGSSKVLASLVVVLLLLLAALTMAVLSYPAITVGFLGITALWVLYLCGEEPLIQLVDSRAARGGKCNKKLVILAGALRAVQGLRSTHEKEHKIKAILYSICVVFLLFIPDSGLRSFIDSYPPLMAVPILVCIVLTTIWVSHWMVQCMHERALRRVPDRLRRDVQGSQAVQGMMQEIWSCLQERGRHQRRSSERRIHEILARSDDDMLNELIERMSQSCDCSLEKVLGYFQDTSDRAARSELIEFLCMNRANDLSIRSKSAILHTLMIMRLTFCSSAEACVAELLLSVDGDDLSDLKSMQDGLGDIHSMHKLVFQDVTDKEIRHRVLSHFLSEGTAQVAHRALMMSGHFKQLLQLGEKHDCVPDHLKFVLESDHDSSYSGQCGHSWLKIITDMDDTLESSGARWPAGIDASYPRHTPYPGVTAFYRELQGGGEVGQLVALSARPHLVGEFVEQGIFKRFNKLMEEHGLHTMPALLTGSVDSGGRFLLSGGDEDGMRALARKKFESFEEYIALYPEFRIVFVGDNGQADYAVGQMMCKKYPHNVEQVWIHEVQPRQKTWSYKEDPGAPIEFVEDYIVAAISAARRPHPLVSPEGLRRIVVAAVDDFKKITNWPSEAHRETEAARLNQSVVQACEVLRSCGMDDSVELIDADKQKTAPADSDAQESAPVDGSRADSAGRSIFGLRPRFAKPSGVQSASATKQSAGQELAGDENAANECQTCEQDWQAETKDTVSEVPEQSNGVPTAEIPKADGKSIAAVSFFGLARGLVGGGSSQPAPPTSSPAKKPEPAMPDAQMPLQELPPCVEVPSASPPLADANSRPNGLSEAGTSAGAAVGGNVSTAGVSAGATSGGGGGCGGGPSGGSGSNAVGGDNNSGTSSSVGCGNSAATSSGTGRSLFGNLRDFTKSALSSSKVQQDDGCERLPLQAEVSCSELQAPDQLASVDECVLSSPLSGEEGPIADPISSGKQSLLGKISGLAKAVPQQSSAPESSPRQVEPHSARSVAELTAAYEQQGQLQCQKDELERGIAEMRSQILALETKMGAVNGANDGAVPKVTNAKVSGNATRRPFFGIGRSRNTEAPRDDASSCTVNNVDTISEVTIGLETNGAVVTNPSTLPDESCNVLPSSSDASLTTASALLQKNSLLGITRRTESSSSFMKVVQSFESLPYTSDDGTLAMMAVSEEGEGGGGVTVHPEVESEVAQGGRMQVQEPSPAQLGQQIEGATDVGVPSQRMTLFGIIKSRGAAPTVLPMTDCGTVAHQPLSDCQEAEPSTQAEHVLPHSSVIAESAGFKQSPQGSSESCTAGAVLVKNGSEHEIPGIESGCPQGKA